VVPAVTFETLGAICRVSAGEEAFLLLGEFVVCQEP
jgi:hypothetical protein